MLLLDLFSDDSLLHIMYKHDNLLLNIIVICFNYFFVFYPYGEV